MLIRTPMTRIPVHRMLDRMLEDAFADVTNTRTMPLNVQENEDNYSLTAEMPGMNPEDINISLHDNVLTIRAEVQTENVDENSRVLLQERRYGAYERSIRFPVAVDSNNVTADYVNGILKVEIPKAPEAKPRQIPVAVNRIEG